MNSTEQRRLDEEYMGRALVLAEQACSLDEVPVGAVLIMHGETIGTGSNRCVIDTDPTAHAEIVAIRAAAAQQQSSRLDGATLYVTLEPCLMCCGAILQARVARLVFGAREPRTGGVVSVHDSLRLPGIDHHVAITEGIREQESASLLRAFFNQRRSLKP